MSSMCFGQELDCDSFKKGDFKIVDSISGTTIINRSGKYQIEYNTRMNLKAKFKLNWISNCSYELKFIKVLENPNNIPIPENMVLTVKIVEILEKSYIQKLSSNISDLVIRDEVFIIKKDTKD
jgi:hypothetical protein